jgi:pimeloyl-ACP methyl ester carboxylesterase
MSVPAASVNARFIEASGARLWVRDTHGGKPAVVLLHGLGGSSEELAEVADLLAPRHRVISVDQRGHGRSTRRPTDVSSGAFAGDVAVVISELLDGEPAAIVGQSMGGHAALHFAASYPGLVACLVMIEATVGGGGSRTADAVAERLRRWPVPFNDRAAAARFFGPSPTGRMWAAGLEPTPDGLRPRFDIDIMHSALLFIGAQPSWTQWDSIRIPTLLLNAQHGDVDMAQFKEMCHRQPAATAITVLGSGHNIHLDQPRVLADLLLQFLPGHD